MIHICLLFLSAFFLQKTWDSFVDLQPKENSWDQAKKDIVVEQIFPCPSDHHVLFEKLENLDL